MLLKHFARLHSSPRMLEIVHKKSFRNIQTNDVHSIHKGQLGAARE
jgi:hypothetical protein